MRILSPTPLKRVCRRFIKASSTNPDTVDIHNIIFSFPPPFFIEYLPLDFLEQGLLITRLEFSLLEEEMVFPIFFFLHQYLNYYMSLGGDHEAVV